MATGKVGQHAHAFGRPRLGRLRLGLLFCILATMAAAATAQEPAKTFDDQTSVVQVAVPVNVLSKDGLPIAGLTAADFRVFDEGKSQELVGFDVIDLRQLNAAAAAEKIAELPSVARRNFLLLFDFTWSTAPAIVKARQAAHELVLNALHPSDLVAIATFSLEFGPRLLVTFTPDRAQLARAIDTLGLQRRPGVASQRVDPLRFMIEPPTGFASQGGGTGGGGSTIRRDLEQAALESLRVIGKQMERSELNYQRSRITAWSRELADLAKALNSVAGRKHVIYFSEGFDSDLLLGRRPVSSGSEYETERLDRLQGRLWMVNSDQTHGSVGLQSDIADMLTAFRRADCVIQAVDIAGLRAEVGGGESSHARSKGSDALFYLANETGGELFEASNKLTEQLDRVLKRSELTYILSFQPRQIALDGTYHKLKVKLVDKKGSRLSYRTGYYAPRPFQDLDPLEKNLLASDAIASAVPLEEIGLAVLAAPFQAAAARAYVPVIIEISGTDLFVGHPEGQRLAVEIYGYVTNQKGEMRDFFSQTAAFDVAIHQHKILTSGVKYYSALELASGQYLLRVLVRNATTGRTGVKSASVTVPRYDEAKTTLLPPFFMDEPANKWLLVRDNSSGNSGNSGSVVYPFTVNGEPFVPAAKPAIRPDESVKFCLMTYNLGEGDPTLESWVVDADGSNNTLGNVQIEERTITGISGFDKILASFRAPSELPQGEYMLEVALTDATSGEQQRGSIPFQILN
jgi:VWFA-related protein